MKMTKEQAIEKKNELIISYFERSSQATKNPIKMPI